LISNLHQENQALKSRADELSVNDAGQAASIEAQKATIEKAEKEISSLKKHCEEYRDVISDYKKALHHEFVPQLHDLRSQLNAKHAELEKHQKQIGIK